MRVVTCGQEDPTLPWMRGPVPPKARLHPEWHAIRSNQTSRRASGALSMAYLSCCEGHRPAALVNPFGWPS
jgi:hypothetical protein